MLTTQRRQFIELAKPRSFVGLMSLYDNNYRRLQRLLGGFLPEPGEALVSRVPGDVALHIDGLARSRFTHTFRLTYLFDGVPDPDLIVRTYHDAQLAEAMNCSHRHRHRLLRRFPTDRGGELQQRWMRNLMLNKWLEYCHERGHCFGPVEITLREPIDAGLR
ncbi:MAG: DUF1249 domain-containing protein [Gammaproteobacteria bacterium]